MLHFSDPGWVLPVDVQMLHVAETANEMQQQQQQQQPSLSVPSKLGVA
jgi:hypothetical protein